MPTLILLRHAKSDWNAPVSDAERPLNDRGRRQAAEAGDWLRVHQPGIDAAVVSTARRAQETFECAALDVPAVSSDAAYTFDPTELLQIVRKRTEDSVLVVSHEPALAELVHLLTGESVEMKTSAIAVLELRSWVSGGTLVAHGRPPS